jgi:hypothetical protein
MYGKRLKVQRHEPDIHISAQCTVLKLIFLNLLKLKGKNAECGFLPKSVVELSFKSPGFFGTVLWVI